MALLFMDGFDHYVTADITKKWTSNTGNAINTTLGRRGGGCLSIGWQTMVKSLGVNASTLVVGCAINASAYAARSPLRFGDSGTAQMSIHINTDGTIAVYRGTQISGTLMGTSSNTLSTSSYQYLEFKVVFHNTAGSFEVRVNGAVWVSGSSVDTTNTANSYANQLIVGYEGNPGAITTYLDDLYVCDGTGTANNDFLGDCRVDTLYPVSDGNYSQLSCSTGSTHYSLVDETAPNTTDYNFSSAVGNKDTYGMGDLPTTPTTVYGVQVNVMALKNDAGTRGIKPLVRSGTTDSLGAETMLSTTQSDVLAVYETNPNTSTAWTATTVNAVEVGAQVSS